MRRWSIQFVLILFTFVSIASQAIAGSGERSEEGSGFQSNHVFLNGPGGDSISPFSGDAETVVNIGPTLKAGGGLELGLTLHHSSKIWVRWDTNAATALKRRGPFGVGWKLHVGRVYQSHRSGPGEWIYESPDGAQHPIMFNVPTPGKKDQIETAYYPGTTFYHGTTDSTFIRAEPMAGANPIQLPLGPEEEDIDYPDPNLEGLDAWRLYMGNGVVHFFERTDEIDTAHTNEYFGDDFGSSATNPHWYLTRIEKWDAAGQVVGRIAVTYESTADKAHCISRIDFLALNAAGVLTVQRHITFTNETSVLGMAVEGGVTRSITFPAVNGQAPATATYTFQYKLPVGTNHRLIFNPPYQGWTTTWENQFLLEKIIFPSPLSAYPMEFTYDEIESDGITGELTERKLPTGALIQYGHATYSYGIGAQAVIFVREVISKHIFLNGVSGTTSDGEWTYTRARQGNMHPSSATVRDPFGNETVYDFTATGLTSAVKIYRGYAPVTPGEPADLVRTQRTEYFDVHNSENILPQHDWTVFHDFQNKIVQTQRLDPAPFGHFKELREYGFQQFPLNAIGILEEDVIPYRKTLLTYGIVDSARWDLWFINRLDQSVTTDGTGTPLRKTTFTYTDDGRPLTQRSYSDPSTSGGAEDIVSENLYDAATANLERSFTYKAGTASPSTKVPGYGNRLEYFTDNVFTRYARVLDPSNPTSTTSMAFTGYANNEFERESVTGTVTAVKDSAGIRSALSYDTMGRLTQISPTNDSSEKATNIEYTSLLETRVFRGTAASDPNNYTETIYKYDALARLIETRRKTETGCEALQKTTYDITGRVIFVTEWGFDSGCGGSQLASGTQLFSTTRGTAFHYYTGSDPNAEGVYDALGRLQKVVIVDGEPSTSDNSTEADYDGPATTVTISDTGTPPSSTRYERDAFGNLVFVDAPEGADGRYIYSALGELTHVELVSLPSGGSLGIQPRSFVYDRLGRLKSSTNPENGTVQFTSYDAMGRLLEKLDSDGRKFSFTYDAAGRILASSSAEDTTPANTPSTSPRTYGPSHLLAQYFYDQSGVTNGFGHLTQMDSFDETGAIVSRRKFNYAGRNGRLSEESTIFAGWDGREGISSLDAELKTCYSYDLLGLLSEQRYPAASACVTGSAPTGVARLKYSYAYGVLDTIKDVNRGAVNPPTDLIKAVIYSAAGASRKLTHGNNLATSIWPDKRGRPEHISVLSDPTCAAVDPNDATCTSSSKRLFGTGQYRYDGAGNILSIGPGTDGPADTFSYDRLSRLVAATINFKDISSVQHSYTQQFLFDDFGNLRDSAANKPMRKKLDGGAELGSTMTVEQATNRLDAHNGTEVYYDQRGNMLNDADHRYVFDDRNRLLAAADIVKTYPVGQYAYEGGMRIMKSNPGTGERAFYVRDSGGNVLSEFTLPPAKHDEFHQKDYFYALGRVIGMAEEEAPPPIQGFYGAFIVPEDGFPYVGLYWTPNPDPDVKYRVWRKTGTGGAWTQMGADLPAGTSSYGGSGSDFTTYFYRVSAVDVSSGLEGVPSRTLRIAFGSQATPSAPSNLTLEKRDRSLTLHWQRSSEDTGFSGSSSDPSSILIGYQVYRANGSGGWDMINLLPLPEPMFRDLQVSPGQSYTYQVRAINTAWLESEGSVVASGQPGDYDPPAPPTGFRALSGPGAGEITLVWNASPEQDLDGYQVYRKVGGNYTTQGTLRPSTSRELKVTGLTAGQYTFAIAAKDATAYSGLSADASARPRSSIGVPPQGGGTNLRWEDNVGYVSSSWVPVTGASLYRVYRKRDDQPWSAFQHVGSVYNPSDEYDDYSADLCQGYEYIVRSVDSANDESADPGEGSFTRRMLRPNKPTADGDAVNLTITLEWDGGFAGGCIPVQDGFEVTGWIIKTDLNSNTTWTPDEEDSDCVYEVPVSGPSADIIITDPSMLSCTLTYPPGTSTTNLRQFALFAVVKDLNHSGDPLDPLMTSHSFISEDICARIGTTGAATGVCQDLSENDPTISGGGGGGDEDNPEGEDGAPTEILYHRHGRLDLPMIPDSKEVHIATLAPQQPPPNGSETTRRASATEYPATRSEICSDADVTGGQQSMGRRSRDPRAELLALAARVKSSMSRFHPENVDEVMSSAGLGSATSPYRMIGTPSAKKFRFLYFHHDHLGSVRVVTKADGSKAADSKFLPFGEEVTPSLAMTTSHRFTGHETDAENGVNYMAARYYSPLTGRFLSSDPLRTSSTQPRLGNLYSYTANNPSNFVDPDGMFHRFVSSPFISHEGLTKGAMSALGLSGANRGIGNYVNLARDVANVDRGTFTGPALNNYLHFGGTEAARTEGTAATLDLGRRDYVGAYNHLANALHSAQDAVAHSDVNWIQHCLKTLSGMNPDDTTDIGKMLNGFKNTVSVLNAFLDALQDEGMTLEKFFGEVAFWRSFDDRATLTREAGREHRLSDTAGIDNWMASSNAAHPFYLPSAFSGAGSRGIIRIWTDSMDRVGGRGP